MRVTVAAADLSHALKQSVAQRNGTMPILQHARLEAAGDKLLIETSDTEIYLRTAIPAQVEGFAAVCLNAGLLESIASGAGDVILRDDGKVNRGRSHFTVPALPANDFPAPEETDFEAIDVDPLALADALAQVAYAYNDDDVQAFVRAVHIEPGRVWSTNRYQLGRVSLPSYQGPAIRLPGAQVRRVIEALGEGAMLAVATNGRTTRMLRVQRGDVTLTVRCIDPDKVPPVDQATVPLRTDPVRVQRKALVAALRTLMPFIQLGVGKSDPVLVVEARDNALALSDRASAGTELVDVEGEIPKGALPARYGMNARHLLATLAVIDTDIVEVYAPDSGRLVFLPDDGHQDHVYHLLMTYRL